MSRTKDKLMDELESYEDDPFTEDMFMSTTATTPKAAVEDLVKEAIKEEVRKRKNAEGVELEAAQETTTAPEVAAPVKLEAKEGQVMFNKLLKKKLAHDFPVSVFKDEDWDEKVRGFIPKVDPSYHIVTEHAEAILRAWELNDKTLIHGPTGAGKSSVVQQLCGITHRPFIRVNCSGDMDSSMIFGQLLAKDGSTVWQDGTVTEAVKYGAVFAWDEWDVTPSEISMGLQWLLEDDGKLFLKEMPGASHEKFIKPHEHFRLVAIGNTQGQGDETGAHSGTNVQNTATLDRFGTCIRIGYLPESVEVKMLVTKFSTFINDSVAKPLVQFANLIRQGYNSGQLSLTVSPRTLLGVCKKLSFGMSLAESLDVVYINKLPESHQRVARELYKKVYGSK